MVQAGHGPIFIRDSRDSAMREVHPPAPPLGVMADFDGERVAAIKIEPGGLLAAISDGVLEAKSAGDEF